MEPGLEELAALLPNISSHLRGMLTSLHLAATQAIPAEAREQDPALDARAAVLDQNFYRMMRLVNSLSALEDMKEGRTLPLRDTDLVRMLGDICEFSGDLAELLGIHLRFCCAMERRICAVDPAALEQAVYHLLSNALKFTDRGGTVTVELEKRGEELAISVTDTGCGMSCRQLETVLHKGPQPVGTEPPPRGVGLGLPLCRAMAERHGGRLTGQSQPGKGSRFTIFLPERQLGSRLSDVPTVYHGGFSRPLLGLADALPADAYTLRNQS